LKRINSVQDEEAAGSNPATPTVKFLVDGMIAKRGDHAIDRFVGYPLARSDLCARHATGRIGRKWHRSRTSAFTG
jgi:hypothetical protein